MVMLHVANQVGLDPAEKTPKDKMWTEVVMDLRLMMPMIRKDPPRVIPAIAHWNTPKSAGSAVGRRARSERTPSTLTCPTSAIEPEFRQASRCTRRSSVQPH